MKLSAARPETKPPAALVVGRDDQGAGWPDDGEPRFIVATVSGYTIDPRTGGVRWGHAKELPTSAAVLDRAYAHKVVREWIPTAGGSRRGGWCERQADALCAELNAQDAAGELTEDVA